MNIAIIKVTGPALKKDKGLKQFWDAHKGECALCFERMRWAMRAQQGSQFYYVLAFCKECFHRLPGTLAAKGALAESPDMMTMGGPVIMQAARDRLMLVFNEVMADELSVRSATQGAESMKHFVHSLLSHGGAAMMGMGMIDGKQIKLDSINDILKEMGVELPKPHLPSPPPTPTEPPDEP
jgi:hypothetical protein